MKKISTIGLDLAKRVFQVHGINDLGQVVVQKQLHRSDVLDWFSKQEKCLVGMESCATSTYWAREIGNLGHEVKLIPPAYVKPYVRRQKNDKTDAAAICEAVSRPSMRFVALKTIEQQSIQVLHRTRELLVTQRTQTINALRAHLAEFGWIFPLGNLGVSKAIQAVQTLTERDCPVLVQQVLSSLVSQIEQLKKEVSKLDQHMLAWHRANADSQRLATIPGIGVVTASALVAAIGDGKHFQSGREFAAWLGMVPRQNSSGGKERLGRISKQGNAYVRRLLVVGATALLRGDYRKNAAGGAWFTELLMRKPARVATVALANKMARVAWAVLNRGDVYRATAIAANEAENPAENSVAVAA
jgi:transposase